VVFLITLESYFIVKVLSAGGHCEDLQIGRGQTQDIDAIIANLFCGRGSEADDWYLWKVVSEPPQFFEGRAEVMAPF
jgi:hypothetical protein